jgi:hypothetical protein
VRRWSALYSLFVVPDDRVREGIVAILDSVVELHMARVRVCNGGREEKRGDGGGGGVCLAIRGCFIAIFAHTRLKPIRCIEILLEISMLN